MKQAESVVSLRLANDMLKRADRLIPKLAQTDLAAAGAMSRSTVLRLAIMRGLDALEKEYK